MLEVEEKDEMRNFKLAVSGEDIMNFFSLKPDKIIGEIKEEIKEAVLSGKIRNSQEEGFELMKSIGKEKGLLN